MGAAALCAGPGAVGHAVRPLAVRDPRAAVTSFLKQGGQVVTFDVFDTLLWRRVLFPADAFELLPHGQGRRLRAPAEAAVTAVCRRFLRREPRLEDIYRVYPFDRADELALEARLARANPWCLQVVMDLVARGVNVAAISDMYLSSAQIAALLQAVGYPPLPVYVSSEAGVSKHAGGRLFAHVAGHFSTPRSAWMHVGDNPHADVAMAQPQGLATCLVQTPRDTLLGLLPALSSRRIRQRMAPDPTLLGELAMALHLALPSRPASDAGLAARLARLLAEAGPSGWSAQAIADRALATSDEGWAA